MLKLENSHSRPGRCRSFVANPRRGVTPVTLHSPRPLLIPKAGIALHARLLAAASSRPLAKGVTKVKKDRNRVITRKDATERMRNMRIPSRARFIRFLSKITYAQGAGLVVRRHRVITPCISGKKLALANPC